MATRVHLKRFSQLSFRDLLTVILLAVLVIGAVLWVAQRFVKPAPPRTFTISAGFEGGAYYVYAQRYREILARDGVDLIVQPSAGAVENLKRLRDPDSGVDVALVQSGLLGGEPAEGLVSLGSLFFEPLWVFYRGETRLDRLTDLHGMRIAVGAEGSGTRPLAIQLLSANGISTGNSALLPIGGEPARKAFAEGYADAIMLVSAPETDILKAVLGVPGARLMSFVQAEAYTRIYPVLTHVLVPRGTLSLKRDLPRDNIHLVAPTATLVARDSLHPALISLLLGAAMEVHGGPGLLHKAGVFPSGMGHDFPLADAARHYYTSGPPFLQRYLPFWIAVLVDRLLVLIIPLIAVAIPLVRIMPGLYSWRIRSRIFKLYGDLRVLDDEVREHYEPGRHAEYRKRLGEIEERANRRRIPLAYAGELYNLREHIQLVRDELRLRRTSGAAS